MLEQLVKDTLCMPIRPHMLRVVALKGSSVAILYSDGATDSDGATASHHASKLSYYLVPVSNTRMYLGKYVCPDAVHCHVCGSKRGAQVMLLCDACNKGVHI